ncbi:MAG: FxLYD domain-containing protein [Cyanobacteria bacterium J06635_15]
MKNPLIGITALVLPLALAAPSALAHDDFCYMEIDGQTINLDHMCGSPDQVPTQEPVTARPTTSSAGYYLERSTRDLINSSSDSWVRLSRVQLQDGYLTGIAFNQGALPANYVRIDYDLLDADRNVVESFFNVTQIDSLAPQQQQAFRIWVGYFMEYQGATTPRAHASWQEWVQE